MRGRVSGFSLIELSIALVIMGILMSGVLAYSELSHKRQKLNQENTGSEKVQNALKAYYIMNGAYPCPAGTIFTASDRDFGRAPQSCTLANLTARGIHPSDLGVTISSNPSGQNVVSGILPFRSLGIADADALDQHGNIYLYTVTERLTDPAEFDQSAGAIDIRAGTGLSRLNPPFTAQYAVVSTGADGVGGFSSNGTPIAPCDRTKTDGENCNGDAIFIDADQAYAIRGGASVAVYDDRVFYRQYDTSLNAKGGVLFYVMGGCGANFAPVDAHGRTIVGAETISPTPSYGAGATPELCYSPKYTNSIMIEPDSYGRSTRCPDDWDLIGYKIVMAAGAGGDEDGLDGDDSGSGVSSVYLVCAR